MAARLNNNPKTRNCGRVETAVRLDIRVLRKAGFLKEGTTSILRGPGGEIILADLRDIQNACLLVLIVPYRQRLQLTFRAAPFGGRRWFMLDEQGRPCEVLYRSGDVFASRTAAGLSYRCQSQGDIDRMLTNRDKLRHKVNGSALRGPARGRNRRALLKRLADHEEFFEHVAGAIVHQPKRKQASARLRAERSKKRLERAREQIERNRKTTSQEVIEKFEHLLKPAKMTKRPLGELSSDSDCEVRPKELSLRLLNRLGYVKSGKLTGNQIGWPQKWLGKGRRLYLLFDLRKRAQWTAMVVVECEGQIRAQHFGVTEVRGKFGKTEHVFEDLATGTQAGRLVFQRGSMKMVEQDCFEAHDPRSTLPAAQKPLFSPLPLHFGEDIVTLKIAPPQQIDSLPAPVKVRIRP